MIWTDFVYGPTAQQVARTLLNSGAYLVRTDVTEEDFFTWKSKIRAPVYCNCRKVAASPGAAAVVQKALGRSIRSAFPETECVVGVAEAGIVWSTAMLLELGLRQAWVQKQPKEHGIKGRVACDPPEGVNAVLVDDLVASGDSLEKAVDSLREEKGMKVVGVQSIVNWNFAEMRTRFERLQIPVRCLVSFGELLGAAHEARLVSADAVEELTAFYRNPRSHQWNLSKLTSFGMSANRTAI